MKLTPEAFTALGDLQEIYQQEQQLKLTKAQVISAALIQMLKSK